jgi:hypothetical protein
MGTAISFICRGLTESRWATYRAKVGKQKRTARGHMGYHNARGAPTHMRTYRACPALMSEFRSDA